MKLLRKVLKISTKNSALGISAERYQLFVPYIEESVLCVRGCFGWLKRIYPEIFQSSQLQRALPMTKSLSEEDNHWYCTVNNSTHSSQVHCSFVMSLPQKNRFGPKA